MGLDPEIGVGVSSVQGTGVSYSMASNPKNQFCSTKPRCLTMPSRLVPDGTSCRRRSWSERPEIFHRSVSR
jgi:hypothetical protein